MNFHRLLSFTLVLSVFMLSTACKCFPPILEKEFVKQAENGAPYAEVIPIREVVPTDINGDVVYTLLVLFQYGSCQKYTIRKAITCGNSACCGLRLDLYKTYLLPIRKDGEMSRINSCQFIRLKSALTPKEKEFLYMRKPRCSSK